MESVNIKTLVELAAADKGDGFTALYEQLVDRVFAFVSFRTNGREEAREVTQDVFIELYKSLPKFVYQSDAAFYAFLFTIVRRQLAQHYKRVQKHETAHVPEETLVASEVGVEKLTSVQQALESLDEVSREIIVLHHWSRFTFAEIGSLINMTESAVRVRHHRARATLAKVLTT